MDWQQKNRFEELEKIISVKDVIANDKTIELMKVKVELRELKNEFNKLRKLDVKVTDLKKSNKLI